MTYLYQARAEAGAPERPIEFLLARWPEIKRKQAKLWLHHRAILVDGAPARHDTPVRPGSEVAVRAGKFAGPETKLPSGLRILHEDGQILVVEKPPGLLSIATDRGERQTAYFQLTAYLRGRGLRERVFIVHRLDRETSGLLVFAKTPQAQRRLQENWEKAEKTYAAVVQGTFQPPSGTIRSHLNETTGPDRSGYRVFSEKAPSEHTREAVTHYKTVKTGPAYSLVEVKLETGRRNQIRVHFSEAGHPIAGDEKYGVSHDPLRRLALHASALRFPHPEGGAAMRFQSPAPATFTTLVEKAASIPVAPAARSERSAKSGPEARPAAARRPKGGDRTPQRKPAPSRRRGRP